MARSSWVFFFLCTPVLALSQLSDSTYNINKKRLSLFTIGGSAAYGITLVGLNRLWYEDSERQPFQFFNDNTEWKQVDKLGHVFSTFYFSYGIARALRWSNMEPRKSDLVGALVGF